MKLWNCRCSELDRTHRCSVITVTMFSLEITLHRQVQSQQYTITQTTYTLLAQSNGAIWLRGIIHFETRVDTVTRQKHSCHNINVSSSHRLCVQHWLLSQHQCLIVTQTVCTALTPVTSSMCYHHTDCVYITTSMFHHQTGCVYIFTSINLFLREPG